MARDLWLLVANPAARSGAAEAQVRGAVSAMQAHGLPVEVLSTRPDGGTAAEVAEALRVGPYRGVVAMGGDGTFHEVANGLLQSGRPLPMGLLPAGTGNNQARSLGLPVGDLAGAIGVIAAGKLTRMDGAHVVLSTPDGSEARCWAFDSIGFGLSARALHFRFEDKAVAERTTLLREVYRDEWVYAGAAVRALLTSAIDDLRFDATVTTEHGTFVYEGLHDLILNNTRVYARAWVIDPSSRHDDGRMELLPILGMDAWAAHALVSLDGNPLREWLDVDPGLVRAARFGIVLTPPDGTDIPAQVDGEPRPATGRVDVTVHRRVLPLFAPEAPTLGAPYGPADVGSAVVPGKGGPGGPHDGHGLVGVPHHPVAH